jgi:hypothetical protein
MAIAVASTAPVLVAAAGYKPALHTPGLTCKAFDKLGREIPRSAARRCLFLRMVADAHPEWSPARRAKFKACDSDGLYVNHVVPLACGGCDVPSNLELMTQAEWKGRTGPERYDCGRHQGGKW